MRLQVLSVRTEVPLDRLKEGGVVFIQQQGDKMYSCVPKNKSYVSIHSYSG